MQPDTLPSRTGPDGGPAAADAGWGSPLPLPASLDITLADRLHHSLLERIATERPLSVDGSEVERVSTPCVQLLVAAAASARAHGLPFRISGASQVLTEAVRDLGLTRALGLEDDR